MSRPHIILHLICCSFVYEYACLYIFVYFYCCLLCLLWLFLHVVGSRPIIDYAYCDWAKFCYNINSRYDCCLIMYRKLMTKKVAWKKKWELIGDKSRVKGSKGELVICVLIYAKGLLFYPSISISLSFSILLAP